MASENYQRWRDFQRERQGRQRKKKGRFAWTGLKERTLWDWLQLALIPLVIAGGTVAFSILQSQASERVSEQQHQTDLQIAQQQYQNNINIANDQQQETALQTYLDRMSDLLLNDNLRTSKPRDEVREVARARTLTLLPQLNGTRKSVVVRFLYEAGLIYSYNATHANSNPVVELIGGDLSGANLSATILVGVDLSGTNLSGTILTLADLSEANLSRATGTTDVQLSKAFSLQGTIMPDGTKHP